MQHLEQGSAQSELPKESPRKDERWRWGELSVEGFL
jgi:hypothetical protein